MGSLVYEPGVDPLTTQPLYVVVEFEDYVGPAIIPDFPKWVPVAPMTIKN